MIYTHRFDDTLKAMAFVKIANESPTIDPQLLAFIDLDGKLSEEIGLETFCDLTNEMKAEAIVDSFDIEAMQDEALHVFMKDMDKDFDEDVGGVELAELTHAEEKLDHALKMSADLDNYISTRATLLSGTYLEGIGTESLNHALESLSGFLDKAMEAAKAAFGKVVSSIKKIAEMIEAKVKALIEKVKKMIEDIKLKGKKLVNNAKAHPMKSFLMVIGTIAAVAGIIYVYAQYNKGYNKEEIEQYKFYKGAEDKLRELRLKMEQAKATMNAASGPGGASPAEINRLADEIKKTEAAMAAWASEKRELFAKMKDDSLSEKAKAEIHRKLADRSNEQKSRNADLAKNKERLEAAKSGKPFGPSPAEQAQALFDYGSLRAQVAQINFKLANTKISWMQPKKSMAKQIDDLCRDTFLQRKGKTVDLKDGQTVPIAEFNEAFPPRENIVDISKGLFKAILWHPELWVPLLVAAINKLVSSIREYVSSVQETGSNRFARQSSRSIFSMLKNIVARCVSFISGTVASEHSQYA